jgi:hypothetical protein
VTCRPGCAVRRPARRWHRQRRPAACHACPLCSQRPLHLRPWLRRRGWRPAARLVRPLWLLLLAPEHAATFSWRQAAPDSVLLVGVERGLEALCTHKAAEAHILRVTFRCPHLAARGAHRWIEKLGVLGAAGGVLLPVQRSPLLGFLERVVLCVLPGAVHQVASDVCEHGFLISFDDECQIPVRINTKPAGSNGSGADAFKVAPQSCVRPRLRCTCRIYRSSPIRRCGTDLGQR